jgi:hypothetical protein
MNQNAYPARGEDVFADLPIRATCDNMHVNDTANFNPAGRGRSARRQP